MSLARNIANLPNGDDAPIYACRAWVNFDGDPVAIRAAYNVSSVGDNGGLGNYRVNFTTAMPDDKYCVQLSHSTPSGAAGQHAIDENNINTTYVDVICWLYNATAQVDRNHVFVAIFR